MDVISKLRTFLETNPTEAQLKEWMSQLPPHEYCECAVYLLRREPTGFTRVLDMRYTAKDAHQLPDEELFQKLAQALDDGLDTSSGKIGMVNPKANPEPISRFASLWNEAVRRGFQREDIGFGMRGHLKTSPKLALFKQEPTWKSFEKLVARIHILFCRDAIVNWSEMVRDASGVQRQIDVTIRSKTGPHEVFGIISCKHEKRPVSITDVEAFVTTKRDINAAIGIMVSSSGYQQGAIAKAEVHDVRLWTLEEAEHAAWREEIRTVELLYPMFSEFQLHPPLPEGCIPEGISVDTANLTISVGETTVPIRHAFASAIQDATQKCAPLPCSFNLNFPEGSSVHVFKQTFPLERIEFHFTHKVAVQERKQMKVPMGVQYDFKKHNDTQKYTVSERELPPLGVDGE